jgi:hypothetical protein
VLESVGRLLVDVVETLFWVVEDAGSVVREVVIAVPLLWVPLLFDVDLEVGVFPLEDEPQPAASSAAVRSGRSRLVVRPDIRRISAPSSYSLLASV